MPTTDFQDNSDGGENQDTGSLTINSTVDELGGNDKQSLIRATRAEFEAERQALLLVVMAELLGPPDLERALDAFVCALQRRLGTKRVSLGVIADDGTLNLAAISQQVRVDMASNEVRLLTNVMEECLEHERLLCFPNTEKSVSMLPAHRALGTRREPISIATVPLYKDDQPVGVLLLERQLAKPFIATTVELLELVASKSALALSLRKDADRNALGRARLYWRKTLENHLGDRQTGKRLLYAAGLCCGVYAGLVPLTDYVSAHAELVPGEQRLVTAPFDGFVESVNVEPGESVVAGQLLASLETRELELEGNRRDGQIDSVEAQFRAAMASHDRKATAVARARLARERALRAVIDQRLRRIELRAPMTGFIVSGDPTDSIGAPVTRGDTLFEISQADGYDVHLLVHERDINDIHEGQTGTLSLRARPAQELSLQVHAVHPVAESRDGASRFRVRATLELPDGIIVRPGESGLARLEVGTTNVLRMVSDFVIRQVSKLAWKVSL
ncbi:MAG: HlyD family efflux transporter periplasmic adaptor subunit [Granulosicoccus sp.]